MDESTAIRLRSRGEIRAIFAGIPGSNATQRYPDDLQCATTLGWVPAISNI